MSGGFYKYRCKYFLSHECPNWVYVNHAPCADCCVSHKIDAIEHVRLHQTNTARPLDVKASTLLMEARCTLLDALSQWEHTQQDIHSRQEPRSILAVNMTLMLMTRCSMGLMTKHDTKV